MKNIRKKYFKGIVAYALVVFMSSCDLFDLDINTDPNNPSQASLNLLLTNVELNASATFAGDINDMAMGFMAITSDFDDYDLTNATWNNTWNYLYSNPLKDLDGMIKATAEQREAGTPNPHYEGIAKVLKAYYFSLMVDLWNSVPYTEAFNGDAATATLEPAFTPGAEIYADAVSLVDQAIAHFAETSPVAVTGDLIYGSGNSATASIAAWTRAAWSLKYRLLLQSRLVDAATKKTQIEAISTANLISTGAQDFQFVFGKIPNPDDRHPMYIEGYAGGEAAYSYFGHEFMFEMLRKNDPRRPFYFKRQTSAVLDPNDPTDKQTIPCSQRTDCKYGYFPLSPFVTQALYGVPPSGLSDSQEAFLAGFFGRDRSDPSGVPNDNSIRTTVGVYPAGGLYDDVAELGGGNKGAGNGIFPMITSWMVKLYQVEAILALGVAGDARTLFRDAMVDQMAKVSALGTSLDAQAVAITTAARDTYINARLAEYDAAATDADKLNVVLTEARFMNFGNGFEIYNAFRRTGFPNNLQTPLQLPRQFALRLPYALDEINLNPFTPVVIYDSPNDAVFWDQLKFQF